MSPLTNSTWIARVHMLLRQGFGVEDIAIRLRCDVAAVRNEVEILRSDGTLDHIYRMMRHDMREAAR